ncbi:MAG: zinc-binding dehydrogenase, partial [Christensenellaceae bacterium]|nr:zinc-binding dehydrogenase [Christensenellaceae bacterium]
MATMKGVVVTAPGEVCVKYDVPKPVCGDYEALVEVKYCGFCNGTDLHVIYGTMTKESGLGEYPTLLGHEGSGVVVEVGKKVRNIKLGDRYFHTNLYPEVGGGYTRTYGGMCDFGLVADYQAMLEDGYKEEDLPFLNPQIPHYGKFGKFPEDISMEDGCILLTMGECMSAAQNFGAGPGKSILIYGSGPMGIGVAKYCKLFGAEKVVSCDLDAKRLKECQRIAGVDRVIDTSKENLTEALNGELFDIVIDAVGMTKILYEGSTFLKSGGVVGSMGVLRSNDLMMNVQALKNNTRLHMLNLPFNEYGVMEQNIQWIREGKISPKDFYSHIVNYDEIDEAIRLVKSKEAMKVV